MKLFSYRVRTLYIEAVINEMNYEFYDLDITIHDEGHNFYLITFNTYNNTIVKFTKVDLDIIHTFFRNESLFISSEIIEIEDESEKEL